MKLDSQVLVACALFILLIVLCMRKHPYTISDKFSILEKIKQASSPTFGQKTSKILHFSATKTNSKFHFQSIFHRFQSMYIHYFVNWPNWHVDIGKIFLYDKKVCRLNSWPCMCMKIHIGQDLAKLKIMVTKTFKKTKIW